MLKDIKNYLDFAKGSLPNCTKIPLSIYVIYRKYNMYIEIKPDKKYNIYNNFNFRG